jgi:penicillin-binding protein 1B
MAKKKKSSKRNPKLTASSTRTKAVLDKGKSAFTAILWRVGLVLILLAVGGIVYLDINIRKQFDGQKWALPAHLYTRPMELFVGQNLDPVTLQDELDELGYQRANKVERVGTYQVSSQNITIFFREFQFWDTLRPSGKVTISLRGSTVSDIRFNGESLDILRLEPRLFASAAPSDHEDRQLLHLQDVPEQLVQALISVEDRQFYSHFGINPLGIARAMVRNVTAGKLVQGGSTITQQLVKNYYLSSERTIRRKLTEMVMAILLEFHYSKDEILQAYINQVYLAQAGNRAIHGFSLGSRYFFARPVNELGLAELATLAGIIKGPSYYNPLRYPDRAKARRNIVLKTMLEENYISEQEYQEAVARDLRLDHGQSSSASLTYPSFLGYVRQDLQQDYRSDDIQSEGLRIYTSLNPRIQATLEQAISTELQAIERAHGIEEGSMQAAAVVVRIDNGEVAAMVGDRVARYSGYNRVLHAKRPVGSLIKPFVYLAALQQPEQYSLASLLNDRNITVSQAGSPDWIPENYGGDEHGDVLLIDALARSYNLATVDLGMKIGVDKVIQTLHDAGHKAPLQPLPSLLLGATSMSVMDVAQIYLTLASGGFEMPIKSVRSILSKEGEPLNRYPLAINQSFELEPVSLINFALQDVVRKGTGRGTLRYFEYDYGLAGKTGTTNDNRDSWFAGFSGNYLTVVWVGRDDYKPTKVTGASGAAKIWARAMSNMPLQRLELPHTENMLTRQVFYSNDDSIVECDQNRELAIMIASKDLTNISCYDKYQEFDLDWRDQESHHFEKRKGSSWFERLFN